MDALWLAMASVYGHRWTSAHGADQAAGSGDTWARGLAGLSAAQLGAGMDACITSSDPWPPTLPEFRAMCFGIPPLAAVRLDLSKNDPFTVLVWQHLDGYRMKQVSADQADRMLREAYELAREHVMRGGALPEIVGAIEQEKREPKPADPEVAAAAIAAARELLNVREPAPEPEAQPKVDLIAIEDLLQAHYSDRKSAAAGDSA